MIIRNDRTEEMAGNGELHTMGITYNEGWKTIGNYRQWEMRDNGEYQLNHDDRQWECQTMEHYIQ